MATPVVPAAGRATRRAAAWPAVLLFGAVLAVPVTASGSRTARAGAATSVQVPATIDASGSKDVTDALNTFLAGVRPGTTVEFRAGARYRVEGVVRLAAAQDVTLDGHGAELFATTDGHAATPPTGGFGARWPRRREHLEVRGGSNITIRQLDVHGANPHAGATAASFVPALEGQAGIAIVGSAGVTLDDVSVEDTYGDFVYLTGGASNVTVKGSRFTGSGRQGIAIAGAEHVDIGHNDLTGVGRTVFDLEPPGRALAQDVRIHDNRVGDYVDFLLSSGGGGAGANGIWLENNQVRGGHGVSVSAGVTRRTRSDYHVIGNQGTGRARPVDTAGQDGLMQLTNLDRVEIRGNRQAVGSGVDAVVLDRVCHLTMSANAFAGARNEQSVLAPCGATAPAPARRRATSTSTTDTRAAAAPASGGTGGSGGSGGSGGTIAIVAAVVAGIALAAGGGFWLGRRRLASPTPPGSRATRVGTGPLGPNRPQNR